MNEKSHTRTRFIIGVLLLALLSGIFYGCTTEPEATPTPTRTPAGEPANPTAEPSPTSTSTPEPEPTPTSTPTPRPENVNPLTGEVVSDPSLLDRVPVAIKVSNHPGWAVRPQYGLNSADIVFEHYNEGYYSTRFTAIYLGKDPSVVGPVRSGRLIDLHIPPMYDAVLAAWGFSNGVLEIFKNSDLYPDRVASYSLPAALPPDPFYRDTSVDVPFEHTGRTDPARVREWANAHGITGHRELDGMLFSEEPTVDGTPATYVKIPWQDCLAEWRYDEETGRYLRWSEGAVHMDALDGQQMNAANVVVLYVPHWNTDIVEDPHNGVLSLEYALWNSNRAIIFRDGVRIDAFWQHWEREDMLTLTDEEGNVIPLAVGNTFYQVIPTEGVVVESQP